ncbi:hypothetical protein NBO_72g0010 [Nosema bombycis CQ1]|uniref:Uncharacterized protein n=1 Tax=Nosema bombycis (strain CQ1 / CVCC 102059) TaxID=578461 RepID=R0MH71_NOSB1|nr:hypothetical protein NBO_72g0010 [Nosema bombycis CQ1]|eukprot:EOB13475.1 hypothetical protein NBO_72g0010 [Nosema bombycis CQ1]
MAFSNTIVSNFVSFSVNLNIFSSSSCTLLFTFFIFKFRDSFINFNLLIFSLIFKSISSLLIF